MSLLQWFAVNAASGGTGVYGSGAVAASSSVSADGYKGGIGTSTITSTATAESTGGVDKAASGTVSSTSSIEYTGERSSRWKDVTVSVTHSVSAAGQTSFGESGDAVVSELTSANGTGKASRVGAASVSCSAAITTTYLKNKPAKSAEVSVSVVSDISVTVFAWIATSTTNLTDNFNRADLGSNYTLVSTPFYNQAGGYIAGSIYNSTIYVAGASQKSCVLVEGGPYDTDQWIRGYLYFSGANESIGFILNAQLSGGYLAGHYIAIGRSITGWYIATPSRLRGAANGHSYPSYFRGVSLSYGYEGSQAFYFKIERVGGFIRYLIDDVVIRTFPLYGDVLTGGQPAIVIQANAYVNYPYVDNLTTGDYGTPTKQGDHRQVAMAMGTGTPEINMDPKAGCFIVKENGFLPGYDNATKYSPVITATRAKTGATVTIEIAATHTLVAAGKAKEGTATVSCSSSIAVTKSTGRSKPVEITSVSFIGLKHRFSPPVSFSLVSSVSVTYRHTAKRAVTCPVTSSIVVERNTTKQQLLYVQNSLDANNFQQMALGAAPSAATTGSGWTAGTTTAGNTSEFQAGTERAASTFAVSSTLPQAPTTSGNGLRSDTTFTGIFKPGNFVISLPWVAVTNGGRQDGFFRARLYKGSNASGSGATAILGTGSAYVSSDTVTDLDVGAPVTLSVTIANSGDITFYNEYLFVTLAWEITGRSTNAGADILLRVGSASYVRTSPLESAARSVDATVPVSAQVAVVGLVTIHAGAATLTATSSVTATGVAAPSYSGSATVDVSSSVTSTYAHHKQQTASLSGTTSVTSAGSGAHSASSVATSASSSVSATGSASSGAPKLTLEDGSGVLLLEDASYLLLE